jgi:phosphonate transport system substrate-binding protein
MINRFLRFWAIFLPLGTLILESESTWARPIHIGSISTEPAAEIKKFVPLANYLGSRLQPEGIDQGKVVVAKDISEMAALLREGKVDLYIDSFFPSVAVSRLSGSKFLLRRWKKGVGEYHTVIFTKKDSSISRLADLKGKMIALEEPYSTSGYVVPKMILAQEGLKLAHKANVLAPVGYGEVGYVFSYGDDNTMVWVLRGKVLAGAMDNHSYLKEGGKNLDSLKILHRTFSIPRQIVSHRADLPAELGARIKEILIKMDQSEEGKKTLQDFEKTTKFDELPDQSMPPLLKLQKFIDAELEVK